MEGQAATPLLAVDLDGHEKLVEDGRDGLALEALVLHHMTPVAGAVTHLQGRTRRAVPALPLLATPTACGPACK